MQDSQDQYTFRAPLVNAFNSVVTVITTKTKQLFLGAVLGALLGLGYAALKPTTYQSNISFFVEDSKSSSSSLMSMVAGQFGLDLGSLTGGNGVLAGDNVLELAKSKLLLQRALQTPYPLAGKDSTGKGLIISASRSIIFAENPALEAETLRDAINQYR